ncbi:hypothetical protein EKE94_07670 [Mesobaculum littorinae]|uniref:Uncharacterized protein n=1 Tax=Mesobaculum littorinae TaxID=2486419 RepID=A0A438AJD6_9RHOB|nr:hypothetical protein [Mesobaculum littorinae]RVV98769.1 hypothetical protein EKE94_07670 [Mesobaculum littorinae]
MADRIRSQDHSRDTDKLLSDADAPEQGGRSGGELERQVGTRDEAKRAEKGEQAGATRVTKSDEKGQGNLGGLHGTGDEEGS